MKITRIKGSASKKVSIEVRKGLWKSWEVGFGAEAELEEGEVWHLASKRLDAALKELAKESLDPKKNGGGSNQTSDAGESSSDDNTVAGDTDQFFGIASTLADVYRS